jgi:hypothetical protein
MASCGKPEAEPAACKPGTLGCRCESDDTCDGNLVCDTYGRCARGGSGGTAGSGAGGDDSGGKGGSTGGTTGGTNATGGKGGTGNAGGEAGDAGDAGETGGGRGGRNGGAGRSGLGGTGGDTGGSAGTAGTGVTAGTAGDTAGTSGSAGATAGVGGASGSGGSAGNGGGGTGGVACTVITLDEEVDARSFAPEAATYQYITAPVGAGEDDFFTVEFYSSAFGAGFNGEDTGTFQIGEGDDGNYRTCSRCVRFIEDAGGTQFFALDGEMYIPPLSDHMEGYPNLTLSNVTLREVTIDETTFETTVVRAGRCVVVESLNVVVEPMPSGWTCDPTYYFDGNCDCGCGIRDRDCADGTFASCEYCNCDGDDFNCMGEVSVSMTDNALCE